MALLIDSVRRNFGLKVTAVLIAVGLWFTFNYFGTSHEAYSKTIELPVTVHGVGAGLVAAPAADRVTVELSGPRPDVEAVSQDDLAAYVDCSGRRPGVYSLPVNVVGRDADKIVTESPSQTIVNLDRYAFRTVPVVARGTDGGSLANASVAPATITVAGGESSVAQVAAAEVTVPEPGSLPAGFAAEMKPDAVDARMQHVPGVEVLGVVRVTGPRQESAQ